MSDVDPPTPRCFPAVPPEVLVTILSRLPLRFLLPCRLVCRAWRRVVDTGGLLRGARPDMAAVFDNFKSLLYPVSA